MKDLKNILSIPKITSGQAIKALRNNFKVSQNQLCKAIGISQTNLSAYENDHRNLGLETAVKLAVFFQVNIEDLIFPNGLEKDLQDYEKIVKSSKLLAQESRE